MRRTKDNFLNGDACSFGEDPVLAGDQPSVVQRPSALVIYHESQVFFTKKSANGLSINYDCYILY